MIGEQIHRRNSLKEDGGRLHPCQENRHVPPPVDIVFRAVPVRARFQPRKNKPRKRKRRRRPERPTPTVADFAYGTDSPRQKFDFWQAKSDKPTPVVLLIHGGGWQGGDKTGYGTSGDPAVPRRGHLRRVAQLPLHRAGDGAEGRAAGEGAACTTRPGRCRRSAPRPRSGTSIPKRVGATGGSAGACTSLWLALHDDLADPKSSDPIARESTRLTCAAVNGAQTSLDPKELREWMPNAIYGGHAFGFAAQGPQPGRGVRPA